MKLRRIVSNVLGFVAATAATVAILAFFVGVGWVSDNTELVAKLKIGLHLLCNGLLVIGLLFAWFVWARNMGRTIFRYWMAKRP